MIDAEKEYYRQSQHTEGGKRSMVEMKEWDGFEGRLWKEEINVRQFI